MGRAIELNRDEAESIVDLIEGYEASNSVLMDLAAQLREQWGMSKRPSDGTAD
jgi:hypothetical protein